MWQSNIIEKYRELEAKYPNHLIIVKENNYYVGMLSAVAILENIFGNRLKKIDEGMMRAIGSPNLNKITIGLEKERISFAVFSDDELLQKATFDSDKNEMISNIKNKNDEIIHSESGKFTNNNTETREYVKYDNVISEGCELYCKQRGRVTVSKIENEIFFVTWKNKEYPQRYCDVGKTLFFSQDDFKVHEYNPDNFSYEKYAPYKKATTYYDINTEIKDANDEFFECKTYHEKEKYKEEKHFNYVEDIIKKEFDVVNSDLNARSITNNGNSEMFDPGIHEEINKIRAKNSDLLAKKNNPYFAEIIELAGDGKPVYIGKSAIPGEVVDYRTEKYANILRLKDYQQGKVKLLREFDIVTGYFIDFADKVNILYRKSEVVDPFLSKILEYNRNKQEMVNIAQTIREEQHKVIIRPIDEDFIVEGCAGSGKTIILLHRLSSLVFNEENLAAENLVIVSPNNLLDEESKEIVSEFEIERAQKGSINALYFKWIRDYLRKQRIFNEFWQQDYISVTENNSLDKDAVYFFYSRDFAKEFSESVKSVFGNYDNMLDGFDFVTYERQRISEVEKKIFGGNFDEKRNSDLIKYYSDMADMYGHICETVSRTNVRAKMDEIQRQMQKLNEIDCEKTVDREKSDMLYREKISQLEAEKEEKEMQLVAEISKKIEFKNSKTAFETMVYEEQRNVLREKIQSIESEIAEINKKIKHEIKLYEKEKNRIESLDNKFTLQKQYDALDVFYSSGNLRGDDEKNEKGEISLSNRIFKEIFDFYKKYAGKINHFIIEKNKSEVVFWKNNYKLYNKKSSFDRFLNGEKREYIIEAIESIISYWKAYSGIDIFVHYEFELYLLLKGLQTLFGEMDSEVKLVSVDEYQDYAPAEIDLLRQLFGSAAINLYGDPKQRINLKTDDEGKRDRYEQYRFTVNYRNGRNITEFINKQLGTDMKPIGMESKVEDNMKPTLSIPIDGEKRVALIVKSEAEYNELIYDKSQDNVFIDDTGRIDKTKLNVIPVRLVKGLEFEQVYVYDKNLNQNERYVAYSRALASLNIIR